MGEEGCIKGGDGRVKKRKILKIDTYMCTRVYIHVCSTITCMYMLYTLDLDIFIFIMNLYIIYLNLIIYYYYIFIYNIDNM